MAEIEDVKRKTLEIERLHGGYIIKPWYLTTPTLVASLDNLLDEVKKVFTNGYGEEIEP